MNTSSICFYRLYQYTKASWGFSASTKSIEKGISRSLSHFRHWRVSFHTVSYHTVILYMDEFPKRMPMGNCNFNNKKVKDHEVQDIFSSSAGVFSYTKYNVYLAELSSLVWICMELIRVSPYLPNVTLKCNSEPLACSWLLKAEGKIPFFTACVLYTMVCFWTQKCWSYGHNLTERTRLPENY